MVIDVLFNTVALLFGLLWLWINVYAYYPIFTSVLKRTAGRITETESPRALEDDVNERERLQDELTDGGTELSADDNLTFDVILPAYEESDVIENSIASVREANYDQDRINLIVLTEPDDDETRSTLGELEQKYEFTELTVPERYPGAQNKPRALNYGFEETDGDVIGIIDAENVYSPGVFRATSRKFTEEDADFVQVRLDMVNEDDGWLNTLFRAEYGYWYEVVFPPFFESDYPIPLGGTTCFFRRDVLEVISERRRKAYGDPWDGDDWQWVRDHGLEGSLPWDPENVTEDFELGLFLWQEGFDPAFLSYSGTDEESPLTLESWMGQRTRWQKGKLYTLMHYLRHPPEGIGKKIHLYTQSMIPHLGPINIAAIFIFLAANLYDYTPLSPVKGLLMVGLGWLAVSVGLFTFGYWKASNQSLLTRLRRTVIVAVTLPFYWLLNWIADIRAFKQTYKGQFHWVKTTHVGRNMLSETEDEGTSVSSRIEWKSDPTWTLKRRHRIFALIVITIVATGLRLYNLDWSLFADELYTLGVRSNLPASDLLFVSHDTHPPLHYLVLHYWMDLFGDSPTSTRLLSVLFSIATILAVYRLGVELYDDRAGLVSAFVIALSVYHVHYGQMVRMYSMLSFFTAMSWYGFARLQSNGKRGRSWYVITTILLVYTHAYALLVIGAQNVYMLLVKNRNNVNWRQWLSLQVIIGFSLGPWLWFVLSNLLQSSTGGVSLISWVPIPSLYNILELLLKFNGYALNFPVVKGVGISRDIATLLLFVYMICAFLAVARYRSDEGWELTRTDAAAQLALLVAVPVLIPVLLSYVLFPMFYYRYAISASIGLYVLVGRGITNIDSRPLMVAVILLVAIASGGMLGDHYQNETIEKWEPGVNCLDAETNPGDFVIFQPQWISDRMGYFEVYSEIDKQHVHGPYAITDKEISNLKQTAQQRKTFWVFRYSEGHQIRSERILEELRETHEEVLLMESISVDVYRFERENESESNTQRQGISDECSVSTSENGSTKSVSSNYGVTHLFEHVSEN